MDVSLKKYIKSSDGIIFKTIHMLNPSEPPHPALPQRIRSLHLIKHQSRRIECGINAINHIYSKYIMIIAKHIAL